jgi:hypothetical protein
MLLLLLLLLLYTARTVLSLPICALITRESCKSILIFSQLHSGRDLGVHAAVYMVVLWNGVWEKWVIVMTKKQPWLNACLVYSIMTEWEPVCLLAERWWKWQYCRAACWWNTLERSCNYYCSGMWAMSRMTSCHLLYAPSCGFSDSDSHMDSLNVLYNYTVPFPHIVLFLIS